MWTINVVVDVDSTYARRAKVLRTVNGNRYLVDMIHDIINRNHLPNEYSILLSNKQAPPTEWIFNIVIQ